jgi:ABC-type Fe3+/spermidine/putrescine transport system ATPase subunit
MFGTLQALHEVRFEVSKGEFVNLRETSGSGKTTTLIIITEFLRPPSWSLTLEDEDIGDVLSALRAVPTFECA